MALKTIRFVVICVLFFLNRVSNGQTMVDIYQLYTDVFTNYNKDIIPSTQTIQVELIFLPTSFVSFDEIKQTLSLMGVINMKWTDQVISWTPASYGNKEYIMLSKKNIWTPPFTLINNVKDLKLLEDDQDVIAMIYHNGTILWTPGGIMTGKCAMDVSTFPYDTQTCSLQFTCFGLTVNEVNLTVSPVAAVNTMYYTPDSDWTVESFWAETYVQDHASRYDIYLTAKRESLYYTVMVVWPTILFGVLNPLVFLLPVESGERIGLSMTIMLSYAIFLTLVSASIPSSSNPMSILLAVMMGIISISGLIVVAVILISIIYYRDESKELNTFWTFIGKSFKCKKKNVVHSVISEKELPVTECVSWKDIANALDMISIIISYILILIVVILFFVYVSK